MKTVGEALITLLEAYGVDTVFGIPGVHTVELYRGLARSSIRHVTPRHEQGAGFMADGYARASGRPGVALLITGPGLTNAITAMAQARGDSVPMLVISSVNATPTLGKGYGYLHELPDQRGLMQKVALFSHRIEDGAELPAVLARAFAVFSSQRPGPVHIEIPLDILARPAGAINLSAATPTAPPMPDVARVAEAARLIAASERPLILAGGGAVRAEAPLQAFAERIDAPVVTTIHGRGLLHRHPLMVPASPSLKAARQLMADADLVIAAGTEFGLTDYDMYADGGFLLPRNLIRIDIDAAQLTRRPATVAIQADTAMALEALLTSPSIATAKQGPGEARAAATREAARAELDPAMLQRLSVLETIRDTLPGAIVVGDSTQPVYAGNLFYDHDRPRGWFNSSMGFGTLGYGIPAAVGAALAVPDAPVVSLSGDGGFQFTLPELGSAVEAGTPVIFVIWNNSGYREIEESMLSVGVEPVGVSPAPPDFCRIAEAYGIAAERLDAAGDLAGALLRGRSTGKPYLIEMVVV